MGKSLVEENEPGRKKRFLLDSLKKEHLLKHTNSTSTHEVTVVYPTVDSDSVLTECVLGLVVQITFEKSFHSREILDALRPEGE